MANNTESAVTEAIGDLKKNRFPSIRAVDRAHGLYRSLLERRAQGILPKHLAHQREARLGPKQEDQLI